MRDRAKFASATLLLSLACGGNENSQPAGGSGGNSGSQGATMGGSAQGGLLGQGGSTAAGQGTSGGSPTATSGGSSPTAGATSSGGATPASGGRAASGGSTSSSSGGGPVAGASTGTGGAAGAPTSVSCSLPLVDRVKITDIAVTSSVVTKGSGINSANMPVILGTSPDGRAKVAWTDGKSVHVTPLSATGERQAPDSVIDGSEVRGFVAHDDGSALLVRRADAMVFVRLDEAGTAKSTLVIVGGTSHTTDGSRWIDDWPHQGRLAWSGTQYAAYFGQTGNFGSQGNHQGDHYSLIAADGLLAKGGWDWGCSHSLDERLAHNGTVWAPVCASDTYPPTGFYFNNKTKISDEPTITNVGGTAKLGGLVPAADGFYLTFTSPTGRASSDVGFVKFSNTGAPSGKVFLTDTASVQESWAHLAKYGDGLLAGWLSGSQLMIASIDTAGAITEAAVATTASIGGQDDFATWANGDAGWAFGSQMLIRVVRVARCQ